MEIKEGMYVRTEEWEISKIKWITLQKWEGLENTVEASFVLETNESLEYPRDNFKTSDNLIDLIEVGDYVNGYLVTRICVDEETNKKYFNLYGSISEWENEDIKSIVTKEQFESVKYEVE